MRLTAANELIRSRNVTASEVAALLPGGHPYTDPRAIYDRLSGDPAERRESEAMAIGSAFEATILRYAEQHDGFTALVWPNDFLRSKIRYDVALLMYVLQVIPVKTHRSTILDAIVERFRRDGPRRLLYASRFGEARTLSASQRHNDGWVRGRGEHDRSFYTEWSAADTNSMFEDHGFERVGKYEGATQGFIYDVPGRL
jgi:hypothetical protein